MRPLLIGINALYMIPGGVGGTEIYLRALLRAFDQLKTPHRFFVFVNRETGAGLAPPSPRFQTIHTGVRAVNRPLRLGWEQLALPGSLRHYRIDVLLNPGFTAPLLAPCPSVTVFHDLQHKRHPEYFRWFDLPFWNLFLFASARRSTRIIAVSQATRQDFLSQYKVDPSLVSVVHHGVDPEFFGIRERRRPPVKGSRYILAVSTLHPHKNFGRLLQAFHDVLRESPDLKLIIVGLRGFAAGSIDAQIAALDLSRNVECTGWVTRERLYDLYAGAESFICPTTFEGFGMPLLEGMAAGLPVACSDIEPLRTLAGDAAFRFDPLDTPAITDALQRITLDEQLRARLTEAGPRRAGEFNWEETARATLQVLLDAVSGDTRQLSR
jgi:glycosyltransferase involved in cell wall biosynthesis